MCHREGNLRAHERGFGHDTVDAHELAQEVTNLRAGDSGSGVIATSAS